MVKSESSEQCVGLKTSWSNMQAHRSFPVQAATVLVLSCGDGYRLTGDQRVTCVRDTEFGFATEPRCEGDWMVLYVLYIFCSV